jgi:aspartate dehydrogenase
MAVVSELRVAIAGLGAVGKVIALELDKGVPGLKLTAVSAKNLGKASEFIQGLNNAVPVVTLDDLTEYADIVVECAPPDLLPEIAAPVLAAGKKLVVLSVGALLAHPELKKAAIDNGGAILVPTGALIGLDAVAAAAEGTINWVRMTTRKPLQGLAGAPFLIENGIDVASITTPTKIFSGTAREAAKGFPANLNVSVALSLAGIGPDMTMLEVWADPTVTRNTHHIEVDADTASFNMTIENIPSENPKTGLITARSAIALLRKLGAPVKIGT